MRVDYIPISNRMNTNTVSALRADSSLAASITKAASKQTYYTIRFLADRDRVQNAYRAYAYFRWVDDCLDQQVIEQCKSIAFLQRQQDFVNRCYSGESVPDLLPQEQMLAGLIHSDHEENSGLQAYIRNMMAVMEFDTYRRGRLILETELDDYSHHLAIGVTEALHYFIGHDDYAPRTEARYLAVLGAHITHMLRDTFEDVALGYLNISDEFVLRHRMDPCDMESTAYPAWVRSRVQIARHYFAEGRHYLAQVKNRRCRFAGYAYIARFEHVLDLIEQDDYFLRDQYPERPNLGETVRMGWSALSLFAVPSTRGGI